MSWTAAVVAISWVLSGMAGLAIIDYRFGKSAGSEDEITWVICTVLGPIALWFSLWDKELS